MLRALVVLTGKAQKRHEQRCARLLARKRRETREGARAGSGVVGTWPAEQIRASDWLTGGGEHPAAAGSANCSPNRQHVFGSIARASRKATSD